MNTCYPEDMPMNGDDWTLPRSDLMAQMMAELAEWESPDRQVAKTRWGPYIVSTVHLPGYKRAGLRDYETMVYIESVGPTRPVEEVRWMNREHAQCGHPLIVKLLMEEVKEACQTNLGLVACLPALIIGIGLLIAMCIQM